MALKVNNKILNTIRFQATGNQFRALSIAVI